VATRRQTITEANGFPGALDERWGETCETAQAEAAVTDVGKSTILSRPPMLGISQKSMKIWNTKFIYPLY
jgi:hypothetical protein